MGKKFVLTLAIAVPPILLTAWLFQQSIRTARADHVPLEFYKTSDLVGKNCSLFGDWCPNSFTDYLTLTVNRSTGSTTKDFLVISSLELDATDLQQHKHSARLLIDGTAVTDIGDATNNLFEASNASGTSDKGGITFATLATTTISTSTEKIIKLQYRAGSNLASLEVRDGSVMALEVPHGTRGATDASETSTGSSTNLVTKLNLTFNSASNTAYLLLAYAEVASEDWENVGSPVFELNYNGVNVSRMEIDTANSVLGAANDDRYLPFTAFYATTTTSTVQSISWKMKGGGASAEAKMQNARIFAVPLAGLTYYNVDQGLSSQQFVSASTTFPTFLSSTQNLAADDYLLLGHASVANEDDAESSYLKMFIGGDAIESAAKHEHDEDDGEQWPVFQAYATTTVSGNQSFGLQGQTSEGGGLHDASFRQNRVFLLRIP